jgi:ketosteroid isomerase-like protein
VLGSGSLVDGERIVPDRLLHYFGYLGLEGAAPVADVDRTVPLEALEAVERGGVFWSACDESHDRLEKFRHRGAVSLASSRLARAFLSGDRCRSNKRGKQMDRSKAEELVKAVYGARVKGDVNEMMKLTDPDIVFEILGSNERSKVAVAIKGADTFRHSLSVLCENFELWNFEILTMLVEGDNIAFHWSAHVRNPKTGKAADSQVMDFWTVKGGKVASIRQGIDTASAEWLASP